MVAGGIDTIEAVGEFAEVFGGDAFAGVGDGDYDQAVLLFGFEGDCAVFWSVAGGVGEEIKDGTLEHWGVDESFFVFEFEFEPGVLIEVGELDSTGDDAGEGVGFEVGVFFEVFGASEGEHLLNEGGHVVGGGLDGFESVAGFGVDVGVFFGGAGDDFYAGEGGSEFVAGVGGELLLGLEKGFFFVEGGLESGDHAVKFFGELGKFVVPLGGDALIEIPSGEVVGSGG